MNYKDEAKNDAKTTACAFQDEIFESFMDHHGEASSDFLNDYSDSYHHENHQPDYTLLEAANVLRDLPEHEETDSGLWDGLKPQEAVCAQASYTYGNAVMHCFRELIKEINEELSELWDEHEAVEDEVDDELKDVLSDEELEDRDEEVEKRQEVVKEKIKAKIKEMVA